MGQSILIITVFVLLLVGAYLTVYDYYKFRAIPLTPIILQRNTFTFMRGLWISGDCYQVSLYLDDDHYVAQMYDDELEYHYAHVKTIGELQDFLDLNHVNFTLHR